MHFRGNLEHRFETDPFLANVALLLLSGGFTAFPIATDGLDILLVESIFVRVNNYSVRMNRERQKGLLLCCDCFGVMIVFGVLDEFENESGFLCIEIGRKAMCNLVKGPHKKHHWGIHTFVLFFLTCAANFLSSSEASDPLLIGPPGSAHHYPL